MSHQGKPEEELIHELETLRRKVSELEESRASLEMTKRLLRESEERFVLLCENASLCYQRLDEGGNLLDVNQVWLSTLGYDRKEVIGKWYGDFLAVSFQDFFRITFPKFIAAGGILKAELVMIRKDGSQIVMALDGKVGCDERGRFKEIHCILHDMTEFRRTAENLQKSERMLQSILASSPVGICYSREKRIQWANDAWKRMFGFDSEDEYCEQPSAILHPSAEAYERTRGVLYNHLKKGEDSESETQLVRKDGSVFHAHIRSTLLNPSDPSEGTISATSDISDRVRHEEALRESEQKFSKAFQNSPDAISITKAADSSFVEVNEAFIRVSGYSREEIVGCSAIELGLWSNQEDRDRFVAALRERGRVLGFEASFKTKWGEARTCLLSGEFIEMRGEQCILGVVHDITERKQTEEALLESEERFRLTFQTSPDAININRLSDGVYVDVNNGFTEITGYSREEIMGKSSLDLDIWHNPQDRQRLIQSLQETGYAPNLEAKFRMKDGTLITGLMSARVITLKGEPHIVSITRNIEEWRKTQEALRESEQRYRTLFEQSMDGVYFVRRDGILTDANPSFCKLFGYTREEMIGKDIHELYFDPAERSQFQEEIEQKGFLRDYEVMFRRNNGEEVDCLITSSVHFGQDGSIVGYRGIVRDLTLQKALQRQLLQAQKLEAIGTLAGGIAHDFNNILQVTLGFSELLLQEKTAEDHEYSDLEKILHAAKSGAELVQRLLMFSRKSEMKPVPMNLNKQIVQVEKLLRRTIPRMVDIRLDLLVDLPKICADPSQVEQVLMNLAVNARDAMPNGGRLTVKTAKETLDEEYCRVHVEANPGEYALLEISDTGSGMDKDTVEHIFEPFFTTKEMGRGTGLGLAMVYGIVKQHNGHVTVYSEVGRGTIFGVYFPVTECEMEADVEPTTTIPALGTETVLLVDDEELVRSLGARILAKHGYNVLQAVNGGEALKIFNKERSQIALVILDLIMPEMGGLECLKKLLKINPQVNVLVTSGYSAEASKQECLDLGAKGFVPKPFRFKELLQQVRRVLDGC